MEDQKNNEEFTRFAHYFRAVEWSSGSGPRFIPEEFSPDCWAKDAWPARFLLRVAIRIHYVWATYSLRKGQATIQGNQAAVCFSSSNVRNLVAFRTGFEGIDKTVTQYAVTFFAVLSGTGGCGSGTTRW